MSNGKTHTTATITQGCLVSLALLVAGFHEVHWLALGFFYQIFCSPDRDLNQPSIGEYYLKKFTLGLHYYWRWLWYPYSICMKHRGKSHAVYGTIVRFIYIMFPITVLLFRDNDNTNVYLCMIYIVVSHVLCIPLYFLAYFIFPYMGASGASLFITGVFLADVLHILFDGMKIRL